MGFKITDKLMYNINDKFPFLVLFSHRFFGKISDLSQEDIISLVEQICGDKKDTDEQGRKYKSKDESLIHYFFV